jgi:hypothetical protein
MAMLRSSHGMSAWGHSRPCRDDRLWREADIHAQQHLVVYKHELEMEAIRIIRVEPLCRVENWFVWIL